MISIIYDRAIYPNIVINALHHLKSMVEFLRRNGLEHDFGGASYSQSYQNLILKILQKLIIQLKMIRDNLKEVMDYFKANPTLLNNKNKKLVNDTLFEKLPRYENYSTTEERDKGVQDYIMNDEIDLENVFLNNSNQRSLISP